MADGTSVTRPFPATGAVLAAGGILLVAAHIAVHDGGAVSDASYLGALGLAALVGWLAVARAPAGERPAWGLIALGITLSAAADLVYAAIGWLGGGEPDLSLGDPLWLAAYVALGLGVLRLTPGREGARGPDVEAIIDSIVAAVVALLTVWVVALDALVSDHSSSILARSVWAAYPVLDVVLLGLVVRLALLHLRSRSPALLLVGAGVGAWLAADLGYLVATSESAGLWLDLGWMVASLLLAGAIVARSGERPRPVVVDAGASACGSSWCRS